MYFGLGLWATISAIAVGTIGRADPAGAADPHRVPHGDEQRDVLRGHVRCPRPLHRQRDRAPDLPVLGGAHRVDQRIRRGRGRGAAVRAPRHRRAPRAWPTRWSRPSRWRWRSGDSAGWCAARRSSRSCGGLLDPHARSPSRAPSAGATKAASRCWGTSGPRGSWSRRRSGSAGALLVCTILGDWTRYISVRAAPAEQVGPGSARWASSSGSWCPPPSARSSPPRSPTPAAPFTVSLANDSPLWYAVLLLPFGVFGGVGLVAQSLYSAGLDLEAVVVRLTRARATVIIGVIGVVLVYLGLLAPTDPGRGHGGVHRPRRARGAVGDDRRDRLPAHPRPLRRRRPAGVQPPDAPAAGTGTPGAGAGRPRWPGRSGRSSGC